MTFSAPLVDPLSYPGIRLVQSVLLTPRGRFEILPIPGEPAGESIVPEGPDGSPSVSDMLDLLDEAPMDERHPVLAIGANANPAHLRLKLHGAAISPVLPMIAAYATGLSVGVSAHVSSDGYLPAAPRLHRSGRTEVVVLYLDDEQLEVFDAENPDCRRIALEVGVDVGVELDELALAPSNLEIHTSKRGLLCLGGKHAGPAPQRTLITKAVRPLHAAGALLDVRSPEQWIEKMRSDADARSSVHQLFDALGLIDLSSVR